MNCVDTTPDARYRFSMLVFDGDYPMAYGGVELNRDLTLSLAEVRAADDNPGNIAFACLPEMRRGRVAAALMKFTVRRKREHSILPGLRGTAAVHGAARGQLAYYHVLEEEGEGVVLTDGEALAKHIDTWDKTDVTEGLPVGFVLGMEGADPILTPGQVHEWFEMGVRVVSLTHYGPSTYAHGTGSEGGLFPPARELLREMSSCGMLLDLTHISDESFFEAVDLYDGPVLASHQNCRALVPGQRQFSDEQLRIVIERGGVIGASMDTWMLCPWYTLDWSNTGGYTRRDYFRREDITLSHVADHIDHVCQLAGNADHAAIGGDTDGQGGIDGAPCEVDSIADYQLLVPILEGRGYARDDIEKIMYGNWVRFYREHLPKND